MTPPLADAGPPVICPITGRTWPAVARFTLRVCGRCTGLIDTRHESWWDDEGRARHIACPTAPVPAPDPLPPTERPKASATYDWPADEVHIARLEELRPAGEVLDA